MLNLDTHMLLFALDGSLKPGEQALLTSEPGHRAVGTSQTRATGPHCDRCPVSGICIHFHQNSRVAPGYGDLSKIDGTGR